MEMDIQNINIFQIYKYLPGEQIYTSGALGCLEVKNHEHPPGERMFTYWLRV